jgi:hypothetical protein
MLRLVAFTLLVALLSAAAAVINPAHGCATDDECGCTTDCLE